MTGHELVHERGLVVFYPPVRDGAEPDEISFVEVKDPAE